jgi:hypothetical protein
MSKEAEQCRLILASFALLRIELRLTHYFPSASNKKKTVSASNTNH